MNEIFKALFKSIPITLIVLAVFVFIIGASNGFSFGPNRSISLDQVGRVSLGSLGLILLGFGIFFAIREQRSSSNNDRTLLSESNLKLYTFAGLKEELREDTIFQDFDTTRQDNINAVYYLWADNFRGSEVNACVDSGSRFLRIRFDNEPGCYPCNVAIRPEQDRALSNLSYKYLTFEAIVPNEALSNENLLKKISLAVRIVNGHFQHWEYAFRPNEYRVFEVSTRWTKFKIDIADHSKWYLFQSDGNYIFGPKKAEFSVIASIIFEMGSKGARPREGKGIVDIRMIRLEKD